MATDPWRRAKNNDPTTWASYTAAVAGASAADGIGFALLDTPFVAVDLDHCLAGEVIDPWAQDWINQANGAYIERTPSGEGLRIIGLDSGEKLHRRWKIEGARDGAGIEVYRRCERYITITGAQLGVCKELSELDLLDKIARQYDGKERSSENGFDFNRASASVDYDEIIRSGAPEGADVSAVFHATIGHLSAKGLSVDKIVETLAKWPNGIGRRYAGRLRGEVERSFEKWQSKRKIRGGTTNASGAAAEPDEPLMWEATDKNGRPLATCANARRALLALEVKFRYDVFHDKNIVEGKIVLQLANLDLVVADLRRKIHAAFGFDPGKNNTIDAVEQLCVRNKFNPITDYLDALKWDGTPRLERWLITYLGAEDTALNREFGRLALIAAVRRARKPRERSSIRSLYSKGRWEVASRWPSRQWRDPRTSQIKPFSAPATARCRSCWPASGYTRSPSFLISAGPIPSICAPSCRERLIAPAKLMVTSGSTYRARRYSSPRRTTISI
jgi:hypothetical protein